MTENSEEIDQKPSNLTENVFPSMIVKNVYEAIKQNRKANTLGFRTISVSAKVLFNGQLMN